MFAPLRLRRVKGMGWFKENTFAIIALAMTVGGWVFALGFRKAEFTELTRRVTHLESTQADDHAILIEIRADLRWIKQALQNHNP